MSQPYASEHHQFQKSPHHQRITTPRYDKCGKLVVGSFLGVHGQAPMTATAMDNSGTYTYEDRFTPEKQQVFSNWYGELPVFPYGNWDFVRPTRGQRLLSAGCDEQTPYLNTNEGNQIRYYNFKLETRQLRYKQDTDEWMMAETTFVVWTDPITGAYVYFSYSDSDGNSYTWSCDDTGNVSEGGTLEDVDWSNFSLFLGSNPSSSNTGSVAYSPVELTSYVYRNAAEGASLQWTAQPKGWQYSGFIPANAIAGGPDIDVDDSMRFTMGASVDGVGGEGIVDNVFANAMSYMDYVDFGNLSAEYPDVYSADDIQLAISLNTSLTPVTTNKRIRFGQRVWVMHSTENALVRLIGDAAYPPRKLLVVEDYGPLMTPQTGNGAAPMAAFDIGLLSGPASFVTGFGHTIGSGQNVIAQKALLYVPGESLVVAKEINRGAYTVYGYAAAGGDETLICPSLSGNIDCMTGFLAPGGYRLIDPRDSIFEFNHIFVWLRDHCDEWLEGSDPTCP